MAEKDGLDPFHICAMAAGQIAHNVGRFDDSDYVKRLAYAMYEAIKGIKPCEKK